MGDLRELEYSKDWTNPEDFPSLTFTKDWESQDDFPTIETDETQVRADMQYLYNEIRDYVNGPFRAYVVATGAAEDNRQGQEEQRETNEAVRVEAETARVSAETQRQDNESSRVTAETARVAAESDRTASEGTRQANETAREQNEKERKTDETLRSMAENSRAYEEKQRVKAEDTRQANETARANAETQRQSNEVARQNAEAQRVSAENARNVWENYDVTKFYTVGNKVAYGGSSYLCIKPCVSVNPMNSTYWLRIAAKGNDGPRGERGNRIWYTDGMPDSYTGNVVQVGDLWINPAYKYGNILPGDAAICTAVSEGSATWRRICSMVGKDGGKWFVGTGSPVTNPVTGAAENDMYLDTSTSDVWQMQANASTGVLEWAGAGNIKGEKGDTGAAGPAGESAYDAAKKGGYTGTEEQFNDALARTGAAATAETAGVVKIGTDFDVAEDGTLSLYKAIAVTSLTCNKATVYEIGTEVSGLDFSWTLNKAPATQSITFGALKFNNLDSSIRSTSELTGDLRAVFEAAVANTNADTNATLEVEDARGAKASKTLPIRFFRYAYSKVGSPGVAPTTASECVKQAALSSFETSGAEFSYAVGDCIWILTTKENAKIQTNVLGQWADVNTYGGSSVTFTQANGAMASYYAYRTDIFTGAGETRYRII